ISARDARGDERLERVLGLEARQAVQIELVLDREASAAQRAQRLAADAVAAILDLAAGLLDHLAAQAVLEHRQMRRAAKARARRRPRPRRRHAVLPLQRCDAEHRLTECRALVVAAVHHECLRSLRADASSIVAPFFALPGNGACASFCQTTTGIEPKARRPSRKDSPTSRKSPSLRRSATTAASATP